jgi:hypothetical protein
MTTIADKFIWMSLDLRSLAALESPTSQPLAGLLGFVGFGYKKQNRDGHGQSLPIQVPD